MSYLFCLVDFRLCVVLSVLAEGLLASHVLSTG